MKLRYSSERPVIILMIFFMTCLVLSAGCSNEVAKAADKKLLNIKLSSAGEVLKNGRNDIVVLVTDNKGQRVEHAQIEVAPWMPEHRHGAMWPPATIEEGNGMYRSVIALSMPGHWELKITVRKGDLEDSATFDFPNVKN